MPTGDTGMKVILKKQSPRGRQFLCKISWNERLEIIAASQSVSIWLRNWRGLGHRFPDPGAGLGDNLLIPVFVPDGRQQSIELLVFHDLSPRYFPSSLRSCCRVRYTVTATSTCEMPSLRAISRWLNPSINRRVKISAERGWSLLRACPSACRNSVTSPSEPRAGSSTSSTELRSEEHTSELQSHVNLVCR